MLDGPRRIGKRVGSTTVTANQGMNRNACLDHSKPHKLLSFSFAGPSDKRRHVTFTSDGDKIERLINPEPKSEEFSFLWIKVLDEHIAALSCENHMFSLHD